VISVAAILSKYPFRVRRANVFNPAVLAMVASYYIFHAVESWWGAQTGHAGLSKLAMLFLVAAGVFIANRVNRMTLVLLGTYFALFTATAFAEIVRTPDLKAVLYFALIILTVRPRTVVIRLCAV
jgi:Na+-transporting NADH:ubiquinone oxidoreductase subunit NqrB